MPLSKFGKLLVLVGMVYFTAMALGFIAIPHWFAMFLREFARWVNTGHITF